MDKENIVKELGVFVKDGKLPCKKAMEFAEKNNIPLKTVGDILNEIKVKVTTCQLGCFP